jgi:hypothetical protein
VRAGPCFDTVGTGFWQLLCEAILQSFFYASMFFVPVLAAMTRFYGSSLILCGTGPGY